MGKPLSTDRNWIRDCFERGKADYRNSVPVDQGPWAGIDAPKDARWQLGWRREMDRAQKRRAGVLPPLEAHCSGCRWWRKIGEEPVGECHGGPPSAAPEGTGQVTLWPITEPDDECGAFRRK